MKQFDDWEENYYRKPPCEEYYEYCDDEDFDEFCNEYSEYCDDEDEDILYGKYLCIETSASIKSQLLILLEQEKDSVKNWKLRVHLPKYFVDYSNYENPVKYLRASEKWAH